MDRRFQDGRRIGFGILKPKAGNGPEIPRRPPDRFCDFETKGRKWTIEPGQNLSDGERMYKMKATKENDKLIITLNARIDTENAAETDKALTEMLKENPGLTPILDASELSYISSAGLRVLMKLRKTTGKALTVRNVSPEVYEIFDTTGFTGILDVKKAPRKIDIDGCEVLGRGENVTIYRLDKERVVKVYDEGTSFEKVEKEQKAAKEAIQKDEFSTIPFSIVMAGKNYGLIFEMPENNDIESLKTEKKAAKKTAKEKRLSNSIYQVALLQSLMQGEYDGVITAEKLAMYGDTGIGTFEGVNGEMIVLDGVIYQALADGSVIIADEKEPIPFANVTFFTEDYELPSLAAADIEELKNKLNEIINAHGQNQFYVARLTGKFDEVSVRSSIKQKPPYRYLNVALAADQKIFDYEAQEGDLVALYCPPYMDGLNMPGWHFHYLSSDKQRGGHVLGVSVKIAKCMIDVISSFNMIVPDRASFNEKKLQEDLTKEIHQAEAEK